MTKAELEEEVLALRAENERLAAELQAAKNAHRDHKQKIREVATKYTQRHGWCEEVKRALEEAGLGVSYKQIGVKVDMPMEMLLEVDAEAFDGLDEEGKKEYLRSALQRTGNVTVASRSESALRVPRQPVVGVGKNVEITDVADIGGAPVAPVGYITRYVSSSGRVMHYYRQGQGRDIWLYSLCNNSMASSGEITEDAPRGEGRVCGACLERARHL